MGKFYGMNRNIVAKTADYQLVEADMGKVFTNRGATGAVVFTLPYPATLDNGWWCEFHTAVLAQDVTVASYASADDIATKNDAAADSVALSTAGERSGGRHQFVWDGAGWCDVIMVMETQTVTVA